MDWETKIPSILWAYHIAYKMDIGTTPFHLVYGLNAIFLIKFLVSTLRLSKDLEWMSHELSKRVNEIEKLDDTQLLAIASMYAEKHRCKH